jgi:P27 family predicted phage terminase small subunit
MYDDHEIPEAPAHLDALARETWDKYVRILNARGFLTDPDLPGFTLLCRTWSEYTAASKHVATHGSDYTDASGQVCETPQSRKLEAAADMLLPLLREFGMTPASRALVEPA